MTKPIEFNRAEMMEWVEHQAAMGPRRPGSPAGHQNEAFLLEKLKAFGLESVRKEPIPITYWAAEEYSLEVGKADQLKPLPHFYIPYTRFTPEAGVQAPLVYVDPKSLSVPKDCEGAIVVTEITFPPFDTELMMKLGMGQYDPDHNIADSKHPATWVRMGWHIYQQAAKKKAAGFIGILTNQPGDNCEMYAPYGFKEKDIMDKPIPGFWVNRNNGVHLKRLAQSGQGQAKAILRGKCTPGIMHNIIGEIPGKKDETIVLSSHHDSPFESPVEDGTGVATVLAIAQNLAAERNLNRRVVVLLTAGHFYGSLGTRTFIQKHRHDVVPKTVLEISLEHMCSEAVEDADGKLVPSGLPEVTGIFVPFNKQISGLVLASMKQHQIDRCIALPPEGPFGAYPPTDGGDWFEAGVPVINHISDPVYLLTSDDALKWVDAERMARAAAAYTSLIQQIDTIPRKNIARTDLIGYRLKMKLLKRIAKMKGTFFGLRPLN